MPGTTDARKVILFLTDTAVFYGSLLAVLLIRYGNSEPTLLLPQHIVPFSMLFAVWLTVFYIFGLYELRYVRNDLEFIRRLLEAVVTNATIAIIVFYFIPAFGITPRLNLSAVIALSAVLVFISRELAVALFRNITKQSVLFLGLTDEVISFAEHLSKNSQYGYRVSALMYVDKKPAQSPPGIPLLPFKPDLSQVITQGHVSLIVASPTVAENTHISKTLLNLIPSGVALTAFPKFYGEMTGRIPISLISERWFLDNAIAAHKFFFDKPKRSLDIAIGLICLVPVAILTPLVALAVRLDSPGPIFYKQKRVGKNGQIFSIRKFRSMIADAEISGARWASEDDPRVTRIGKFLRQSRLDELPQILSIIRGDLSFVGPRPERPEFVQELRRIIPFYDVRHIVKPGLTGWAQVNFPYGASVEDAYLKLQYDLFYIQNRSMALDLTIFLKTILIVLSRAGR